MGSGLFTWLNGLDCLPKVRLVPGNQGLYYGNRQYVMS